MVTVRAYARGELSRPLKLKRPQRMACVKRRVKQVESQRRIVAYVRGLLAKVERKNLWTLAEAGDAGPEDMQRPLNFYAWDCDGLRDDVRDEVVEAIGDERTGM
ncbi:hypothetical protein L612_003900000170 [Rhodococcus rhodochrous J38]|nr:hypothetical protein L612_003900000170 [Rhodococcus rhodochrous J38]